MLSINTRNRGFTLIELMVALVLGLVVIGGVMGVFISTYQANAQNIKSVRLNEEMRAVMSLMTRDIRRAGGRGFDWTATIDWYATYVFGTTGANWVVSRFDNDAPPNSCLLFAYDKDGDDVLDPADGFGYRLRANRVEMRKASANCAATGVTNWESITDDKIANVLNLDFTATTEPGVSGVAVRTVVITLEAGTHTRSTDPTNLAVADCANNIDVVCRRLVETIRVRNDPILP